jgi:hypothetical protein
MMNRNIKVYSHQDPLARNVNLVNGLFHALYLMGSDSSR